jgi:hypothetical protein
MLMFQRKQKNGEVKEVSYINLLHTDKGPRSTAFLCKQLIQNVAEQPLRITPGESELQSLVRPGSKAIRGQL